MVVAGASFALHFRALRKPGEYLKNSEFRLYGSLVLIATGIIAFGIWDSAMWHSSIRDSAFTAVSMVTTTGYATADFGAWAPGLQIIVVGLMAKRIFILPIM